MKQPNQLVNSLIITFSFDIIIALVLYYMVLGMHGLIDVMVISQFIGLSICLFVHLGMYVAENKLNIASIIGIGIGIFAGLFLGIMSGSVLSWGFLYFLRGIDSSEFITGVLTHVIVFGIVFAIPIIYFFVSRDKMAESEKQIASEKIKRLSMEKETAMTTLRLLQAQIEPHFLFNTLSNVISLFDIDVDKAKQMLIDLNEYLRISLQRTRQEMITLDQELELVRRYLDIFKIRMGDRLSYRIQNKTGDTTILFPPLIIQPLVENSIKYGIEPDVSGGSINIDCQIQNNVLEIVISDTGKGLDDDTNKAGIGINNVSQRLETIYGNMASLTLTQNQPSGIKATIEVPL